VSSEDDAVLDLLHDIERKATVTIPDGGEPPEDRPEFGNDILITINATASAFEHIAETIRDWHGIDGINVDVAQ